MKFEDRIRYLDPVAYAKEALNLFDKSQVEVSWTGSRLITSAGYEGAVEFHSLVKSYIQPKLKSEIFRSNLTWRFDGLDFIEKLKSLYRETEHALESTWVVKYFDSSSKDLATCEALEDMDLFLRDFAKLEFKKLFGSEQPESKVTVISDETGSSDRYIASHRQMFDLRGFV
jgi:hypothetical protein